jgi:AcrR family transcriptional regulator
VANATLYRRFPTREDLLVAALRHRLAELDEIAGRLSDSDDPGAALDEWFFHVATHLRTWQGLPDSLARALSDDGAPLSHACQPLLIWTERLPARSTQTSFTRTDLDPVDVFTLVASLAWAADSRGDSEDDLRRMVHLVLQGLCVKVPQPKVDPGITATCVLLILEDDDVLPTRSQYPCRAKLPSRRGGAPGGLGSSTGSRYRSRSTRSDPS